MSGCTSRNGRRKKTWATMAAARFVAAQNIRETGDDHIAYQCPDCGRYHTATVRDHVGRPVRASSDVRPTP